MPLVGRQTGPVAVIDAFGARWTLDVSGLDTHLADELLHLWERTFVVGIEAAASSPGGPDAQDPSFVIRRSGDGRVTVGDQTRATDDLDVPYLVSRVLTGASIQRRAGRCIMLHAAGIATDDGGTVALVARSGTGKTTAGWVLGRTLGYVSDETVAVEHDLSVRAYPKPLSLVVDPRFPTTKHERSPDDLGLVRAPEELHLSAVAVLDRRDDAQSPTLEALGLVEALGEVIPQTSGLFGLDRPLDRLARALTVGGGPYRLTYRDIEDCVGLVAGLAHTLDRAEDDVTWTWFDGREHDVHPTSAPEDLSLSTMVWRNGFRDAILSAGELLVMRDETPFILPGLAATLWLAAGERCSVKDLVAAATVELGPHPNAAAIVVDTVRALIDDRLLTFDPQAGSDAPQGHWQGAEPHFGHPSA